MENPRKIKLFGDRHEAIKKYGKGQALLRATEAISDLLGLPFYRLFSADKTVMAQTIPGMQNQIILSHTPEVGVKEEEEENPSCIVTLFNVPIMIPPMKWYAQGAETFEKVDGVWVIRNPNGVVEVEGVDYIKTYYSVTVFDCSGCSSLDFTIGKEMGAITASTPYRPFWYRSERDDGSLIYTYQDAMVPHYMGNPDAIPLILPDPMNHMIYGFWGGGQAEIIKAGADEGGTYILWKAYTEWSNVGPQVVDFSRTGLGYMLMQGFIQNEGKNLCESKPIIIKVDCCLKPEGERQVILYWESLSGYEAGGPTCVDQAFMFYGSIKICEVPPVIGPLWAKLCTPRNTKIFYVIPEIKGGCLPFEWGLSAGGGWTLTHSEPNGEYGYLSYECTLGSPDANATVDVKVTDRCGRTDTFHSKSCCEVATPLSIGYTSLLMGCSGSQTFTAGGGCGPYSWSLSGDGTLVPAQNGLSAVYTSPATNVDCVNKPTITLSDGCGGSAELDLVLNCYTTPADAILVARWIDTGRDSGCGVGGEAGVPRTRVWIYYDYYDCDGTFRRTDFVYNPCLCENTNTWSNSPPWCNKTSAGPTDCGSPVAPGYCVLYAGWYGNGQEVDLRTPTMKAQGCCPISPLTGIPY